jgi:hypothetical protein
MENSSDNNSDNNSNNNTTLYGTPPTSPLPSRSPSPLPSRSPSPLPSRSLSPVLNRPSSPQQVSHPVSQLPSVSSHPSEYSLSVDLPLHLYAGLGYIYKNLLLTELNSINAKNIAEWKPVTDIKTKIYDMLKTLKDNVEHSLVINESLSDHPLYKNIESVIKDIGISTQSIKDKVRDKVKNKLKPINPTEPINNTTDYFSAEEGNELDSDLESDPDPDSDLESSNNDSGDNNQAGGGNLDETIGKRLTIIAKEINDKLDKTSPIRDMINKLDVETDNKMMYAILLVLQDKNNSHYRNYFQNIKDTIPLNNKIFEKFEEHIEHAIESHQTNKDKDKDFIDTILLAIINNPENVKVKYCYVTDYISPDLTPISVSQLLYINIFRDLLYGSIFHKAIQKFSKYTEAHKLLQDASHEITNESSDNNNATIVPPSPLPIDTDNDNDNDNNESGLNSGDDNDNDNDNDDDNTSTNNSKPNNKVQTAGGKPSILFSLGKANENVINGIVMRLIELLNGMKVKFTDSLNKDRITNLESIEVFPKNSVLDKLKNALIGHLKGQPQTTGQNIEQ